MRNSEVRSILPSEHWPNVLKLALSVGMPEEMPVSLALTEFVNKMSLIAGSTALEVNPRLLPLAQLQSLLEGMSFSTAGLTAGDMWTLFEKKESFLQRWGQPGMLLELCEIYLGQARAHRGRDYLEERLVPQKLSRLRLVDRNERPHTVTFVLTEAEAQRHDNYLERIESFKHSCRQLCPATQTVFVKLEKAAVKKLALGLRIAAAHPILPRRIT